MKIADRNKKRRFVVLWNPKWSTKRFARSFCRHHAHLDRWKAAAFSSFCNWGWMCIPSPPARLIGHSGSRTNRFHHNNKMCDNRWNQIYFSMPATPQTWSRNRTQLHKLPTHAALQRPGLFLFYFLSSIDYKIFIIYYYLFCYFFKVVRVYVPPDFCCCCCFDLSTTRKRRVEHAQWETRSAIGWHVFSVCVPQNFAADAFSSFSV